MATIFTEDSWNGRQVLLTVVKPVGQKLFTQEQGEELIRRARVLQQCDHAHLQPVPDFHLDELRRFCFCTVPCDGEPLWHALETNQPDDRILFDLISHYISVLLYLEMHAPTVVPVFDPTTFFLVANKTLVIQNYQIDLLFVQPAETVLCGAAGFIERISAHVQNREKRKALIEIAQQVGQKQPPAKLNTIHKLRGALRNVIERETLTRQSGGGKDA